MAERTDGMTGGTGKGDDHHDLVEIRADVRDAEDDLVRTVQAIRTKLSFATMKARAREELYDITIDRPREMVRRIKPGASRYSRSAANLMKDQPFIPVALATLVVGTIFLRRLIGGRKVSH